MNTQRIKILNINFNHEATQAVKFAILGACFIVYILVKNRYEIQIIDKVKIGKISDNNFSKNDNLQK